MPGILRVPDSIPSTQKKKVEGGEGRRGEGRGQERRGEEKQREEKKKEKWKNKKNQFHITWINKHFYQLTIDLNKK